MKHLLIVAYGFPPANNMSAYRNLMRAKGFDELGYRVTVVTRSWRPGQQGHAHGDGGVQGIAEELLFTNTRVFRVPFGPAPDTAFGKLQGAVADFQSRRGKSAAGKISRNISFFALPLDFELKLRVDPRELAARLGGARPDFVLASADPWSCFEVGRELASYFGAKYIAEYRDPWTFDDERISLEGFNTFNPNFFSQLKRRWWMHLERSINSSADLVVSVSPPLVQNALRMTGAKKGIVVTNGYDPDEIESVPRKTGDKFTISYTGTLHLAQRTESMFQALELFIDRNRVPLDELRVRFVGPKDSHRWEASVERMRKFRYFDQVVEVTGRVSKFESLTAQRSSHVLIYFPVGKQVGIYSGKIFEYIASGVPTLLMPSDHDVIEALLRETRAGQALDSVEEGARFFEQAYVSWKKTALVAYEPDWAQVRKYSFREQAKRLAAELEAL